MHVAKAVTDHGCHTHTLRGTRLSSEGYATARPAEIKLPVCFLDLISLAFLQVCQWRAAGDRCTLDRSVRLCGMCFTELWVVGNGRRAAAAEGGKLMIGTCAWLAGQRNEQRV